MNLPTVQDWVIVWGTCWWMCHIWGLWECFTGGLGFGTSTTAYDHYIQYSTPPTGINDPILGEKSCVNTVLRDSPHKALPSAWDATSSVGGFLGGLLNMEFLLPTISPNTNKSLEAQMITAPIWTGTVWMIGSTLGRNPVLRLVTSSNKWWIQCFLKVLWVLKYGWK